MKTQRCAREYMPRPHERTQNSPLSGTCGYQQETSSSPSRLLSGIRRRHTWSLHDYLPFTSVFVGLLRSAHETKIGQINCFFFFCAETVSEIEFWDNLDLFFWAETASEACLPTPSQINVNRLREKESKPNMLRKGVYAEASSTKRPQNSPLPGTCG